MHHVPWAHLKRVPGVPEKMFLWQRFCLLLKEYFFWEPCTKIFKLPPSKIFYRILKYMALKKRRLGMECTYVSIKQKQIFANLMHVQTGTFWLRIHIEYHPNGSWIWFWAALPWYPFCTSNEAYKDTL